MSDEIERARAVLSAASERHLRISDDDRAGMLLDAIALDLLAVVDAADGYVADPEIADAGPLAEWDAMCAALDALRARLREHLGGDDG